MQKNILVECGLRRITFLIAQEVSPMLGASEFFTFFKTRCHLFEVCSVDWGRKNQWLKERWLSKWFVLAVDWVMVENCKTSLYLSKSCLTQFSFICLFAERISQVFHIQSKRWGMVKSNEAVLSSLGSLIFRKNIVPSPYDPCILEVQLKCRLQPSPGLVFPVRAPRLYVGLRRHISHPLSLC